MLISVTSCNVNAADSDQTTPLIMAALQGNAVICETLVRTTTTVPYVRPQPTHAPADFFLIKSGA